MARLSLHSSIKKLVQTSVRLLSKVMPKVKKPRAKRPTTAGQAQVNELRQRVKELEARNKELEQLLLSKKPVIEEIITPEALKSEVESFTEDDLPYEIKDDTPEFGPDDLPYEIKDEPQAFTYKDFGSNESLDVLIDFLKSDISGVATDSEFFNMDPTDQKFLLLDYVQFQHESNPALFYKGKKSLELENVPIWGAEFDRFVKNTIEFNDTTAGYSTPDVSGIDDLLSDYIEADY